MELASIDLTKENLTLLLSVIATITSTILAMLRFFDYRKKTKRNFAIEAEVHNPFRFLELKISNKGFRPITFTGYEIHYGNEFRDQIVGIKKLNKPVKLLETDTFTLDISREEIIKLVKDKEITQYYSCELWIKVFFSTREKILTKVNIDPKIITADFYYKAEPYISTDIFLGFKQMESKAIHVRGKSKYSSGKHYI